jgi:hypothetical protein
MPLFDWDNFTMDLFLRVHLFERKEQIAVDVNQFAVDEVLTLERLKIDPSIEMGQHSKFGLLADKFGLNVAIWLLLLGPLALIIGLPRQNLTPET